MGKLRRTKRDAPPVDTSGLLPFSPPFVSTLQKHFLTPSTTSYSIFDGGNHEIILPKTEPMTGGFVRIDLRGAPTATLPPANPNPTNVVVIGGDIQPPKCYSSVTKKLIMNFQSVPAGTWYMFARHGFRSDADGGEFCVQTALGFPSYLAGPFPYDATDQEVQDGINTELQANGWSSGECFEVFNTVAPDSRGGPWEFIPNETFGLGKCKIIVSGTKDGVPFGLTVGGVPLVNADRRPVSASAPTVNDHVTQFNGRFNGFQPLNWRGHFHVEGLKVYSEFCNDAMNCSTVALNSILTWQNCFMKSGGRVWHNDWIHPDGGQAFQGPPAMYMYQCSIESLGNGMINQPRNQGVKPENLRDWYWRRVDVRQHRRAFGGTPDPAKVFSCFEQWDETGVNSPNQHDAGWVMDMGANPAEGQVYVVGINEDTGLLSNEWPDSDLYNQFRTKPSLPLHPSNWLDYPPGLTLNVLPGIPEGATADGYFASPYDDHPQAPGLNYVSPGYTGASLPFLPERLLGEARGSGGWPFP